MTCAQLGVGLKLTMPCSTVPYQLLAGMAACMERNGWSSLDDFRGLRRDRVVVHSKIRRPEGETYRGGYDAEGYAGSDAGSGAAAEAAATTEN